MAEEDDKLIPRDYVVENIKAEIEASTPSRRQRIFEAVAFAALGSIPWVGGVIAVAAREKSKVLAAEEVKNQDQRDWHQ